MIATCVFLTFASCPIAAENLIAQGNLYNGEVYQGIVLAKSYQLGMALDDYWVSEKLDGIRAIWDGSQLYTKNGNIIQAPRWFTSGLPNMRIEGELWAGRGNFNLVQTTVLDKEPDEEAWQHIDFMLFDLPQAAGDYRKRYYDILHWVRNIDQDHIKEVLHSPINSETELLKMLDNMDENAGEGLMLRKSTGLYNAGRSDELLKVKKHHDAEAKIIGYKPGEGKYSGMLGSLHVVNSDGKTFYVGTGLNDEQRRNPPQIGATITYRYNGFTHSGIPRFARFLRERLDE
ncbi:DNA ligase [Vibrio tapetis]